MKRCYLLSFLTFICLYANSQSLRKYPVGNSGCSVFMFCDPGNFDVSYSEDSSKIYTAECINEEVHYGLICVQLLEPIKDSVKAEEMMIAYLDYLKSAFKINSAVGYGKGHVLRNNAAVHGVLDYWEDADKNNWKIKAWTNGGMINVLYAYAKNNLPDTKVNVYLDGIQFPAK